MQFKPEMVEKIVSGQKTQTRRLVKEGDILGNELRDSTKNNFVSNLAVWNDKGSKWKVGKDYAVCPGRGKKGVNWCPDCKGVHGLTKPEDFKDIDCPEIPLRIKITAIRKEKLMKITEGEAIKEGFPIEMFPDKRARVSFLKYFHYVNNLDRTENVNAKGAFFNPDVWVIDFEVVK